MHLLRAGERICTGYVQESGSEYDFGMIVILIADLITSADEILVVTSIAKNGESVGVVKREQRATTR